MGLGNNRAGAHPDDRGRGGAPRQGGRPRRRRRIASPRSRALGHDVRVVIPAYGSIDWLHYAPKLVADVSRPHDRRRSARRDLGDRHRRSPHVAGGRPSHSEGPLDLRPHDSGGRAQVRLLLARRAVGGGGAALEAGRRPRARLAHGRRGLVARRRRGGENPYFRDVASVFTIHNLPYAAQGAGQTLGDYKHSPRRRARCALPEAFRDSLMGIGILGADMLSTGQPDLRPRDPGHRGRLRARRRPARCARIAWPASSTGSTRSRGIRPRTPSSCATSTPRRSRAPGPEQGRAPGRGGARARTRGCRCSASSRGWSRRRASTSRRPRSSAGSIAADSSSCSARAIRPSSTSSRSSRCAIPHRASVRLRFDARYARRIYAGADALLIPSRYEPCGLAQMIAHALRRASRWPGAPAGWPTRWWTPAIPAGPASCSTSSTPWALWDALERALRVYAQPAKWAELQSNGMARDFSWARSATEYAALYERAVTAHSAG